MSNILQKKDESSYIAFKNVTFDKRKKFSWATPGDQGVFMMIPKAELNIDGRYQREQVSKYKVSETAYGLKAIGVLNRLVKEDSQLAERVFGLCADLAHDGEQVKAAVMRGLFYLAVKLNGIADIFTNSHREKLMKLGMSGINTAIQREKYISGVGGRLIEVKACLDIINSGKRNKFRLK